MSGYAWLSQFIAGFFRLGKFTSGYVTFTCVWFFMLGQDISDFVRIGLICSSYLRLGQVS
jgi:hypothetical protein